MLPGFSGQAGGPASEPPKAALSELIADLNERFGVNLGDSDIVRGSAEAAMAEPQVQAAAFANDETNFGHVFDNVFEDKVIEKIEDNTKAFKKFADDRTSTPSSRASPAAMPTSRCAGTWLDTEHHAVRPL